MRYKRNCYLAMSIALSLLLAGLAVGCNSGYTEEDINTAWQEGYAQGFTDGLAQGNQYQDDEISPSNGSWDQEEKLSAGAISWDEAKDHIGERCTVCGPVVGTHWASSSNSQPTFLNIGVDYPDTDRFVVLIWGDDRVNFSQAPEDYYLGKDICVEGLVEEYEGVCEIQVSSPSAIEEQ